MRFVRTRAIRFSFAFALALGASTARAQPTPAELRAARALFAEATKDEQAGRWAAALDKLRRVGDVKMTAGVRYHVALCEENLGRAAAALGDYTAARDSAVAEKNKDVIALVPDAFLDDLRARVPTLAISIPPGMEPSSADLEVALDGQAQSKERLAAPIALDPGVHRVEARAPGRRPFAMVVTLNERDRARVDVALPPIAAEPAPIAASASPTPARANDETSGAEKPQATAARSRLLPIAATAGAVVLAGAGFAAFAIAGAKQSSAESDCVRVTACDDRRGGVRAFDAIALGAWIGGAALGATAIVLWVRPPRDHAGSSGGARVVAGPGSIGVEGAF